MESILEFITLEYRIEHDLGHKKQISALKMIEVSLHGYLDQLLVFSKNG